MVVASRSRSLVCICVLLLLVVCGCQGGFWSKSVSVYELAGISLRAAHDVARPACDSGQISKENCDQIKKVYSDARSSYLLAGDVLVSAIEASDAVKRQAFLEEYGSLSAQFTKLTGDIFDLLVKLGVLKEGGK